MKTNVSLHKEIILKLEMRGISMDDLSKTDIDFWRSKSPETRLLAAELMRRLEYSYVSDNLCMMRVLEIVPHFRND